MIKFLLQNSSGLAEKPAVFCCKVYNMLKNTLHQNWQEKRRGEIAYKRKTSHKTDFLDKAIQPLQSFQDNTFYMCRKIICHE